MASNMNRMLKRIVWKTPNIYTQRTKHVADANRKILIRHKYNTSVEYKQPQVEYEAATTISHTPPITTSDSPTPINTNTPAPNTQTKAHSNSIHTKPIYATTSTNTTNKGTTNSITTNNTIPSHISTNTSTNTISPATNTNNSTLANTITNTTSSTNTSNSDNNDITIPASSQPAHNVTVNLHTCEIAHVASNSFYRRPLPDSLVAFSSTEGRKLFRDAMEQGHMEGYFALAEQFVSQSEPAYCGPATLSMCLNALNIDPNRLWKGPWRWFAEDMLDCCTPLDVVKKRGITFTEFACLAKCNGASVRAVRGDEANLDSFRQAIKEATSQPSLHMVVSYSRQVLGQTGQGHYSPVGGYHPEKDLALMLDVARFKYAPHWVPVETLWYSMQELDEETKKPRGYYMLSRSQEHRPPAVCRITSKTMWAAVASHLSSTSLPLTHTAAQMVEKIVRQLPPEASQVLKTYPEDLYGRLPREHADVTEQFFAEISKSEMCTIVRDVLHNLESSSSTSSTSLSPFHQTKYGPEILGVLLLACPTQLFGDLSTEVRDDLARVRSLDAFTKDVQTEILQIREQMFLALKSNCKQCKKEGEKEDACSSSSGRG